MLLLRRLYDQFLDRLEGMEMIQEMWKRRLIFFLSLCVLTFSLGILPAIAEDGTAEPVLHQFHLVAGWNLISLPFVTDPSPLLVFAGLPAPWFLAEYDAVEHSYHPYTQVSLRPGVGYWLRVPEAVNFTLQGTSVTVRNSCNLLEGWNLVGYPFLGEIGWDDTARARLEWGGQIYSLQQAFDAGILAGDIYSWREDRYFSVKNELRKFSPGYGYWVKLNVPSPGGEGVQYVSANLVFEPGGIASDIASKLLHAAYSGVKQGAKSWTEKKACGWVMSLLTGNKGQGAEVLARLDQMEAQLQDIQASLARVEADFTQLFAQLKQMQAKIIDTILNAQVKDYINRIGTHYNLPTPEGLAYFTQGKTPTTPNIQADVAQFCSNVTGAWDIPVCVDGIHNAIAPSDGSDGLLDSWLAANILTNTATWTFQPQRLMDYYLAYESYFAGLLFYEYRGIQIYTETLNQRDPTGQLTQNYLDRYYTPNLRAEVDRFLIGAARLVIYSANLTTTSTTDPLFQGGQDVLSRAQFFAIQTRDEDSFGMRAILLTTADALKPTGNPTPLVNLANPGKGLSFSASATILRVPEGTAYDLWDSSSSPTFNTFLGSSANWLLLQVNFGPASPAEIGNGWNVRLADSVLPLPVSPAFAVNAYTDGYQLSTTGTILYGLGLGWARPGGAQQFASTLSGGILNNSWVLDINTLRGQESGKGGSCTYSQANGFSDRSFSPGVRFSAKGGATYRLDINGIYQNLRGFLYTGAIPLQAKVRVTYQLDLWLGKWPDAGGDTQLGAWIGIFDYTTKQWAAGSSIWNWNAHGGQSSSGWNKQYGTNCIVTQELQPTLLTGHNYGFCIGISSSTWITKNPATGNLSYNESRNWITFKGATIRF